MMPSVVDFDAGSDLEDFIKGSDESESEPEPSESETEYHSSSEDENAEESDDEGRASSRMRVARRATPMRLYVEPIEMAHADADTAIEADDESDKEASVGDDSEVDDDNPDVLMDVNKSTTRRRTPAATASIVPPAPVTAITSAWSDTVVRRHFSTDSGIRPFAHSRAVGQHWTPKPNQRIRVGDVQGDNAFYAGKEGIVLGRSQTRPGKWRVTVHGSALETALHGETGVAFHSSVLTPTTSLKLHLNTVPTEELAVLRVLVASVTPAIVRAIQQGRPFKSWPDLRTRVPDLTDATATLLKDLCAVNMASTNTTWRAFAALGDDYATQLAQWSKMTVNQRLDARDDASEVIEVEKAERRRERERVRAAAAQPEGEPRAQRPRRKAAIEADAIGYREEDAWRLRLLEAQAWETMQEE